MSAAAAPLAMDQPNWLDDTDNLFGFLRARGFIVGTGEALRVLALLQRLRDAQGRLTELRPEKIALWLAPVLCTSEAEQSALAPALAAYAASYRRPAVDAGPFMSADVTSSPKTLGHMQARSAQPVRRLA